MFYEESEFETSQIKGYPTQEWLIKAAKQQFETGQYQVHFSQTTTIEFLSSQGFEEDSYIWAGDSLESFKGTQRAVVRFPFNADWDTTTQCIAIENQEQLIVDQPVLPEGVQMLTRGTNPVFFHDPNASTTALTRAGIQRELNIVMAGNWTVSQASVPQGSLNLSSTTNTINWVSSTEILKENAIEGLKDQSTQIIGTEVTKEHLIAEFKEVEFDTESIDTLVTDFFLYHASGSVVAFNFHLPSPGAPLESVQPKIKLNWSDFEETDGSEIIIV